MSVINKRIILEKKYTNICLYNSLPLQQRGTKILAVSPGSFYYHTGIRAKIKDIMKYKKLSEKAHFGERLKIENEVNELINIKEFCSKNFIDYFFEMKNIIIELTLDNLNAMLYLFNMNTLRKHQYNRLMRLFRKWSLESNDCHYKISGAKRRLHYKYLKLVEEQ